MPTFNLSELLESPPYIFLSALSSVFVVASIIYGRYFFLTTPLFLYSLIGLFWRQIIVDWQKLKGIEGSNRESIKSEENKKIIEIYHIGNALLLGVLFLVLHSYFFELIALSLVKP
ncbi:MAG: hypothetical protein A3B34_02300 [Candidatus Sungbacteria bacterium RIFCSPLOWO2_01_FULL_54_21]|uniref:Uncharacterized protein n=1 Tax=Candidatus Sungbacteria bacterium RIFCSPLOWO2_01_FULL_54_21 TaxID=1802279 RepID=A0A1G2L8X2_9BACT|nr:MAG: hypothetical protein A3B34_02300 [Candidatus Sungbacteria bacterium RIFCSPLOWO2_01_FULL_54_21]